MFIRPLYARAGWRKKLEREAGRGGEKGSFPKFEKEEKKGREIRKM